MKAMSYNLLDGGIRGGTDVMWRREMEIIRDVNPDLLLLQECKGWERSGYERLFDTEIALKMRGLMAESRLVGCNTAVFFKPKFQPRRFDSRYSAQAWHAHSEIRLALDGFPDPITVLSVHLSPFSPEQRLHEASLFPRFAAPGMLSIVGGDFNCVAPGDPELDWNRMPKEQHVYRALEGVEPPTADRRVGLRMQRAGLVDVARTLIEAAGGEARIAPTASPQEGEQMYRCDQFWVSPRLAPALRAYQVIDTPEARAASDHLPIVMTLDLNAIRQ
jgi:endonuclease/exonuclease/phosphatase family metal-dependent hydrolase